MQCPEQQRCKNVDFKAKPTKESTSTNVTATHDVPGRKQDSKWKLFLITCGPDWPVRRSQQNRAVKYYIKYNITRGP